MEVLTKQEFLESIILASITSLVVNLILNADICLEIVGEFIGFIKRKKESVHFGLALFAYQTYLINVFTLHTAIPPFQILHHGILYQFRTL